MVPPPEILEVTPRTTELIASVTTNELTPIRTTTNPEIAPIEAQLTTVSKTHTDR